MNRFYFTAGTVYALLYFELCAYCVLHIALHSKSLPSWLDTPLRTGEKK